MSVHQMPKQAEKLVTIIADINNREGWWYATSKQLDGLLVAHQDLETVKREIPEVIRALYKVQFNKTVTVQKTIFPYEDDKYAYLAKVAS